MGVDAYDEVAEDKDRVGVQNLGDVRTNNTIVAELEQISAPTAAQ
jgi:hypothetical protein